MKLIAFVQSYLSTLHRDTKAATAIEYAVIAGLMAAALITAVVLVTGAGEGDGAFYSFFQSIAGALTGAAENTD